MKCKYCGMEQSELLEDGQYKGGFCCSEFEADYREDQEYVALHGID